MPNKYRVGSGPIEKINLIIVDAVKIRIVEASRVNKVNIVVDKNITVQRRAEICEFNS